jgi:hypothetical protein
LLDYAQPVILGAQRPRVASVPSYSSSTGREAVELAASAGVMLDDWQAYCLETMLGERADGKWSAFEWAGIVARQNGKGEVLLARELAGLFLLDERLILHSAHEYKTAQEAFFRIKAVIENAPHLARRVRAIRNANGEQGIELHSGSRLRFVARSKGSGRGFTGDCIVLDEAYNLGAEAMAALLPTLSARPNPQLIYTSSAGMEESAQLNAVRERGVRGNEPGLCYLEWSAPADADPLDVNAWAQANPALGGRIPVEFVQLEQRTMPLREFRRERLSIWSTPEDASVIDPESWHPLADPASRPNDPVVFALDVPPDRGSACIAVAGLRPDGLTHVEVIDDKPGTRWVVDRFAALRSRWGVVTCVIDPGSPAGAFIPALEGAGVDLILTTGRQYAQACGAFYDAVLARQLVHLAQPNLDAALVAGRRRPLGDAWAWSRKDTTNIAPLVAVTLAKYGLDSRPPVDVSLSVW